MLLRATENIVAGHMRPSDL